MLNSALWYHHGFHIDVSKEIHSMASCQSVELTLTQDHTVTSDVPCTEKVETYHVTLHFFSLVFQMSIIIVSY